MYSLEALKDLEWEKLLKLRSENGSIVCSPSATAFAFMQTKDQKSLTYLTNVVNKFKGGVPHVYPVELFEQIWMVDRLQRLGIARYFQSEIKERVDFISRHWDGQPISFTRHCNLPDIDDTCMGFRVLRTNGYQVSPDVFRYFEKDGQFVCYPGQSAEAVTAMFNLYRASQVLFPGEKILDDAKKFSYNFLTEKRSTNELLDKWLITKDLPGEVAYALDVPWYANLPRLEARYYIEQYGGEDDIWLGKSYFRMGNVSNNQYLEMAKFDYNHCQTIHQMEWSNIQKWYAHLNIEESLNTSRLLWSYYQAAANIFEPERCNERIAWAKTNVIVNSITSFFARPEFSNSDVQAFANEFANTQYHEKNEKPWNAMMEALHETLNEISSNTRVAYGVDLYPHLHSIWKVWLSNLGKGVDQVEGEAELIVKTINLCSSHCLLNDSFSHPMYQRLSSVVNDFCRQISHKGNRTKGLETESKMQELVQLVLCDSPNDLDANSKQTFLTVAKTFYYRALFDPATINQHIEKVLFENVV
jgi:ent-copalyl diphosphate synthase